MTDIIERVARALFDSAKSRDVLEDGDTWESCAALHEDFFDQARSAIAAMRGPTPEVTEAIQGYAPCGFAFPGDLAWQDAIDAALTQK